MDGRRVTVSLGNSSHVYAALQVVLDLHTHIGVCCQSCRVVWPCPTIKAVDQHMHWPPAHRRPGEDAGEDGSERDPGRAGGG